MPTEAPVRLSIEETNHLRRTCFTEGRRDFCVGCGTQTHDPEGHKGTSRWNPEVWLCTPCSTYEALSEHPDPFDAASLTEAA